MENICIKDVIFSFRHMYLDNLKKLNKRLKKHISIKGKLIDDITIYLDNNKYRDNVIKVKYNFKKGSFGNFIYDLENNVHAESYLHDDVSIKKDEYGKYISNSKGIGIKDDKLSKELEYILKEEFYSKINGYYNDGKMSISFSGYDITFSCNKFRICYNCVGDIIYVYTIDPIKMKDILNTKINLELDDYHTNNIKKMEKILDSNTGDKPDSIPGEYLIKEKEKAITLKRIKKDRLHKYI